MAGGKEGELPTSQRVVFPPTCADPVASQFPCMNLAVMQAIFLCEYFARFRGRKAVIKPSRAFEALYHGLADSPTLAEACPPRRSSRTATAGSADEDQRDTQRRWRLWIELEGRRRLLAACFVLDVHSSIYHEQPRTRHFVLPPEVGAQLSSGSAADSGTAGRPVLPGHGFPIPLTERSMALWAAESADEWAALADGDPEAAGPAFLPDPRSLTVESISGRPPFDHAILLAAEALRLAASPEATTPTQMPPTPQSAMHMDVDSVGGSSVMTPVTPLSATTASAAVSATSALAVTSLSTLFATCPVANAYLALHHTPLHDLLAVSGDSWVFSQKILQPTSFLEHQKRLKEWASGGSGSGSGSGSRLGPHHRRSLSTSASPPSTDALMATRFAARSLVCFLDSGVRPPEQVHGDGGGSGQDQRQCAARRGRMDDIGDYWAIYVCALIIWAVGHRERRSRSISMSAAAPVRAPTVISSSPSSSSSSSSSAATVTAETAAAAGGAESSTSSTANSQNSQHRPQAGITGPDNGGRRATLATATSDAEALAWLRHVAALTRPEDIAEARSAPGAAAVVGLVRRHLDNASSGQRGRLFVDAVRVLRKLDEGLNWKWF